ncbi:MAG: hypothetical protein PHF21_00765 [Bacilli bacterium]|nr:hypothetical protein [Bacilli bacterium]
MKQIKFYKNNKKINIEQYKIVYLFKEKEINIETNDSIIKLNFINKSCLYYLKSQGITLTINVLLMKIIEENNTITLLYTLESEPDVKNTIKIKKNEA